MSKLNRKIQKWRALQPWERRILIKMLLLLPAAWLMLRMWGFNRALRIAEVELPFDSIKIDQTAMERAQRYAQLTAIAARHGIYKANCLQQSLAICWQLRKQGMPAHIKIGVRPKMRPFQAHAWVELEGIPLAQESVAEYEIFDRLTVEWERSTFI